jgi:hypothetical protein
MTRLQHDVTNSWRDVIRNAIEMNLPETSYLLAVGFYRRLRELGLWNDWEDKRKCGTTG